MIWKIANKPNNFYILMKSTKDDYKLYDPAGKSVDVVSGDPLALDIKEFLTTELEIEVTKAIGGRKKIYEEGNVKIIKYEDSWAGVDALTEDTAETVWCSKTTVHARKHIKTNFHIVFENNKPLSAFHYPYGILTIWNENNNHISIRNYGRISKENNNSTYIKTIRLLQNLNIAQADRFNILPDIGYLLIKYPDIELTLEHKEQLNKVSEKHIVELLITQPKLIKHFTDRLKDIKGNDLENLLIQLSAWWDNKAVTKDFISNTNLDTLTEKNLFNILDRRPRLVEYLEPYLDKIVTTRYLDTLVDTATWNEKNTILLPYFISRIDEFSPKVVFRLATRTEKYKDYAMAYLNKAIEDNDYLMRLLYEIPEQLPVIIDKFGRHNTIYILTPEQATKLIAKHPRLWDELKYVLADMLGWTGDEVLMNKLFGLLIEYGAGTTILSNFIDEFIDEISSFEGEDAKTFIKYITPYLPHIPKLRSLYRTLTDNINTE